jgi:high-affinity iron transporter
MLAIIIIVFREVLEAGLIIGIVMAAARGIAGRNFWVCTGVAGGVLGAILVAVFAGVLAAAAAGMGQELFNAAILGIAVAMLTWHSVWMTRHGRELGKQVGDVGRAITAGARPLYALAIVTGVAVLREGAETVLFLYGIASAGGIQSLADLILGGALGIAGGFAIGAGLYFGLLRIPLQHLFAVTNWMILLLAAGMASQAADFLVQANILPPLGQQLWDTSAILTEKSILGRVLHTLVGYVARPMGIQLLVYIATLVLTRLLMGWMGGGSGPQRRSGNVAAQAVLILSIVGLAQLAGAPCAWADFKVRSPIVEYREFEFEHNGSVTFDPKRDLNKDQSYTFALGLGVTPFWKIELEGETEAPPGQNLLYTATTFENTFQLTPQGKYWADFGFFFEYSQGMLRDSTNTVKFGPIVQKETPGFGRYDLLHTLNVFFEKEVGPFSTSRTGFVPAWQSRVLLNPFFQPGFEVYGSIDDLGRAGKFNDQQYNVGPMFAGAYSLAPYGKIKYELGYLFGITPATPRGAVRWKFEYEFPF